MNDEQFRGCSDGGGKENNDDDDDDDDDDDYDDDDVDLDYVWQKHRQSVSVHVL